MNLKDYERREELAGAVKPHAYGEPLDDCLRCGEVAAWDEDFEVGWQSRGSAHAGDPPITLGFLCHDCMAELLEEWGYEAPPEADPE